MSDLPRECPACGGPLRPWPLGGVTVDGCDQCGGVWFDGHELQAVAQRGEGALEHLDGQFQPGLAAATGGGQSLCPKCREPLCGFSFPHAPDVKLDGCRACKGVWFDHGELIALAAKLPRTARPTLKRAAAQPPAEQAALAAGLIERVECPACGAPNPAMSRWCELCKANLHAPPQGGPGQVTATYSYNPLWLLRDLLILVVLAVFLFDRPDYRGRSLGIGEYLPAETAWSILLLVAALGASRWLCKPYAVDLTDRGFTLRSLFSVRFVPWDAIRTGYVTDLGSRAPWAPLVNAISGWGRYGSYGYGSYSEACERSAVSINDKPPRVLLVLHTTRGVIWIGPDLGNHYELVDRIRQHMD